MVNNSNLRTFARERIKQNHSSAMVVYGAVYFIALNISIFVAFATKGFFAVVLIFYAVVLYLALLALLGPLDYGMSGFFIKTIMDKQCAAKECFEGFKADQFERTVVVKAIIFGIQFALTLLLIVPGVLYNLHYCLAGFVMREYPKLNRKEVFKVTGKLMEGHKMQLFMLKVSFIPWFLLGLVTFGIFFIWLAPYYKATLAVFYKQAQTDYAAQDKTYNENFESALGVTHDSAEEKTVAAESIVAAVPEQPKTAEKAVSADEMADNLVKQIDTETIQPIKKEPAPEESKLVLKADESQHAAAFKMGSPMFRTRTQPVEPSAPPVIEMPAAENTAESAPIVPPVSPPVAAPTTTAPAAKPAAVTPNASQVSSVGAKPAEKHQIIETTEGTEKIFYEIAEDRPADVNPRPIPPAIKIPDRIPDAEPEVPAKQQLKLTITPVQKPVALFRTGAGTDGGEASGLQNGFMRGATTASARTVIPTQYSRAQPLTPSAEAKSDQAEKPADGKK